jgi:hypothetical protein
VTPSPRIIRGAKHWFVVGQGTAGDKARLRRYLERHPLRDDSCWGFVSESDAREAARDFVAFDSSFDQCLTMHTCGV